jgi:hypothetical protein
MFQARLFKARSMWTLKHTPLLVMTEAISSDGSTDEATESSRPIDCSRNVELHGEEYLSGTLIACHSSNASTTELCKYY